MQLSEFIAQLEEIAIEHGDIPVYVDDGSCDYVSAGVTADEVSVVDGRERKAHTAVLIAREE